MRCWTGWRLHRTGRDYWISRHAAANDLRSLLHSPSSWRAVTVGGVAVPASHISEQSVYATDGGPQSRCCALQRNRRRLTYKPTGATGSNSSALRRLFPDRSDS